MNPRSPGPQPGALTAWPRSPQTQRILASAWNSGQRRPESRQGLSIVPKTAYRHCYENSLQLPLFVIPAKSLPSAPMRGRGPRLEARGVPARIIAPAKVAAIFISMVSVATGMANCYENRSMSQATELPRTEVPGLQTRQTGGFSPRDIHARGEAYRLPQNAAIFIDLMWPGNAMVFPAQSLPRTPIRGGNPGGWRARPLCEPTLERPWKAAWGSRAGGDGGGFRER